MRATSLDLTVEGADGSRASTRRRCATSRPLLEAEGVAMGRALGIAFVLGEEARAAPSTARDDVTAPRSAGWARPAPAARHHPASIS